MKTLSVSLLVISSLFLTSCGSTENTTQTDSAQSNSSISAQPERKVDIYGKITSIEWNEITLLQVDTSKDPTFTMTPEAKKKYMQAMDEAARMALKEQINSATLWEIKIIIPVGIPMIKKTAQWTDAPTVDASLADLKNGQYISIWTSQDIKENKGVEFVKIAFMQ